MCEGNKRQASLDGTGENGRSTMKKEKIILVPATLLMTAMLAFPGMAAEKITELTIDINAVLTSSDNLDVEAEVSDDGCYIDEVSITNEPSGDWDEDTKPKLKITIGADDDYSFSTSLKKSDVYMGNDDNTVTSVTRSTSKLYVYVTLPKISDIETEYDDSDDDYDLDVYDLVWDDSYGGVAYWEGTDYAKKYQVRVYCDGDIIGSTYTTSNNYYNFCGSFTKAGSYTFKVKAVRGSDESSWRESEPKDVDKSEASAVYANRTAAAAYYGNSSSSGTGNQTSQNSSQTSGGAWLRDNNGWWWCNPDKTYPVANWKQINNVWYYFNQAGYMAENQWVENNGAWYYCGSSGAMVKNQWVESNGLWYYCGESGAMLTSQMIGGQYYVDKNGVWVQ